MTQDADRELLELAAKAAGIAVISWKADGAIVPAANGCAAWNPITDDGDAFRLAVKMKLATDVTEGYSGAQALGVAFFSEPHHNDPNAATRRAVVRAAAAIGKEMP